MERENRQESIIYHISHLHPLKLINSNLNEESAPICHGCRHRCGDSFYLCEPCSYALDPTCARLPRTLCHPNHPAHPLVLHLMPAYHSGSFLCNACGKDGGDFCFHCARCQFDLHLPCAALPERLRHHSHPHPLTLTAEDPSTGQGYICDLCRGTFEAKSQWLYLCKACDFGGHVNCFTMLEAEAPRAQQTNRPAGWNVQQQDNPAAQLFAMQQKLQASMFARNMMVQKGRNLVSLTGGPRQVTYYNPAPLPSQYTAMANSMAMNNLALASMNNNSNSGGGGGGGSGGAPTGGNVARINYNQNAYQSWSNRSS